MPAIIDQIHLPPNLAPRLKARNQALVCVYILLGKELPLKVIVGLTAAEFRVHVQTRLAKWQGDNASFPHVTQAFKIIQGYMNTHLMDAPKSPTDGAPFLFPSEKLDSFGNPRTISYGAAWAIIRQALPTHSLQNIQGFLANPHV